MPLVISSLVFLIFLCSDLLVVDPSLVEEVITKGTMTFTLNAQREVCALTKVRQTNYFNFIDHFTHLFALY